MSEPNEPEDVPPEPTPPKGKKWDEEWLEINQIIRRLEEMDAPQRRRALVYLFDRYAGERT